MKQNILVVCYDYDVSRQVAKNLADSFSMRIFDQKELFEFDHMPRTFAEVYRTNGKEYVLRKMRSILKMELEFDDAIFIADNCFADNCYELFYKIKLSNFVVFLTKDIQTELKEINQKKYSFEDCEEFYKISESDLKERELAIRNDVADAVIDINNKTTSQICEEIVDKIKNYYSVK